MMVELEKQGGFYWACFRDEDGQEQRIRTSFAAIPVYRKKAEREAECIRQNYGSTLDKSAIHPVESGSISHPHSRLENDMDLIAIRKETNNLHFNFYYDCPETGRRRRNRKSTGLKDSRINRVKAQQMALDFLNDLSHQHINEPTTKPEPAPEPEQALPSEEAPSPRKIPKTNRSQVLSTPRKKRRKTQLEEAPESISVASVHTLSELIRYYKTRKQYLQLAKNSKRTYETYIAHYILLFFGHVPVKDINSDMIEDFEFELEDHELSARFIGNVIGCLRMLLNFAVKKNILQYCPHYTLSVKTARKKPKYLTPSERDQLLTYVQEKEALFFPIIQFAAFTGTRMGEARSLTWGDVDFATETVLIHRTLDIDGEFKGTKTNKERTIPLHPALMQSLKELWISSPEKRKDSFVFRNQKNKPHSKTTLHKVVVRSSIGAGGPRISFHGLRHTFATIVTNQHGVAKACVLLGHSDIKTTMIYYHSDIEVLKEAIQGL